jgi:RIO-like serine/threonine protein kinase
MTDQEIAKLHADLNTAKTQNATLAAKIEALEAPELDEEDKKVLCAIAKADDGLRHSQIEAETGLATKRVEYRLSRLQKRNFIVLESKNLRPARIHVDAAGLDYLIRNNLL